MMGNMMNPMMFTDQNITSSVRLLRSMIMEFHHKSRLV